MASTGSESSTTLCLARQPILDEKGRVFGYELLYRGAPGDTSCTVPSDLASAQVFTNAVLDMGLDTLTAGRTAFLNVTAALLENIETLLPHEGVVLELLETIEVSPQLIEMCRSLKAMGYRLALDDFVPGSTAEAILPYVSFVKVDVLTTPLADAAALAERLRPTGVTMLAEKVENREVYELTRDAGYSLFQGYYFCRPVTQTGAAIPAQQLAYVRLLAALNKPDLKTVEIEDLVKQDVSLSLRVLRFVNSAAVPVRVEVGSIRQALFLIGMEPIRKWASVWCLAGLNAGATPELSTLALVRARSCELIAERLRGSHASEFFLVGLCSLLDVMLSRSMGDVLDNLPLPATSSEALLGHPGTASAVLEAVIAYESGAWDRAAEAAHRAGALPEALPEAYASALRWALEISRGGIAG